MFAYSQVVHAFYRNVSLYGRNENFEKYQWDIEQEKRVLAEQYNLIHGTSYTLEQIYEQVFPMDTIRFQLKRKNCIKSFFFE